LDRVTEGPKPQLVHDLGATYHTGPVNTIGFRPDIVIECTGAPTLIVQAIAHLGNNGILCLAGVSSKHQPETIDIGTMNRCMVLQNSVIFGTVNANRSHFEMARDALRKADRKWLSRLISRKEDLQSWKQALTRRPDDIKVVIEISAN